MATRIAAIDPNVIWYLTLAVLTAALIGGTVWAHRVWNDLKGDPEETLTDTGELLSPLSEAFAAGHMSAEEYQRITDSVRRAEGPVPSPTIPIRPRIIAAGEREEGSGPVLPPEP